MVLLTLRVASQIFTNHSVFFRLFLVIDRNTYIKKLTQCMMAIFGAIIACIIVCLLIALLLNQLGRSMSWYARPIWLFFLYVIPTVVTSMGVLLIHSKKVQKVRKLIQFEITKKSQQFSNFMQSRALSKILHES